MKKRIVAAWKVLRGEWTAQPPNTNVIVYWNGAPLVNGAYTGTGNTYTVGPYR